MSLPKIDEVINLSDEELNEKILALLVLFSVLCRVVSPHAVLCPVLSETWI